MKRVRHTCPNATKVRGSPHIVCKLSVRDLANATQTEMARHLCAHQYFCPESQGFELTAESRTCQRRQIGGE